MAVVATGYRGDQVKLLPAIFAATVLTLSAGAVRAGELLPARFDGFMSKTMERGRIPGAAIAVVKGDQTVLTRGYGTKDLVKKEAVDEETTFQVGSTTKAFTAALIGMLVDEKKMDWDGKVTQYLTDFELFDPYVSREVTLRDLLSHRTGMPNMGWLWYASPFDSKEILHRLRYQPPGSSFRSKWEYQNCMFLAAGQSSAEAAGTDWHQLLRERIFKPLGMKSSSSTFEKLKKTRNLAMPHAYLDGKVVQVPHRDLNNIAPAGSINSNVVDMAKWVRLQLADGKFEGKELIKKETVAEMHTIQMPFRMGGPVEKLLPQANRFLGYGLGWVVQDFNGKKVIWHTGGIDGMRSFVGLVPEADLGVVVLTNSSYLEDGAAVIGYELIDELLGMDAGWTDKFMKLQEMRIEKIKADEDSQKAKRVKGTTSSLVRTAYEGTYENAVYGNLDVYMENGKLCVSSGPLRKGRLKHWSYDCFKAVWDDRNVDDAFVTFTIDPDGKVTAAQMEGLGTFKRSETPSS